MELCFNYALENDSAFIIRYPKLSCPSELPQFAQKVEEGKGIFVPCSEMTVGNISEKDLLKVKHKILIVSTGGMFSEVKVAVRSVMLKNGYADIYLLRFIKPLDEEYFLSIAKKYYGVVFVEDGVIKGGISEYLNGLLYKNKMFNTKILGFKDRFFDHGNRLQVLQDAGLSSEQIANAVKELADA